MKFRSKIQSIVVFLCILQTFKGIFDDVQQNPSSKMTSFVSVQLPFKVYNHHVAYNTLSMCVLSKDNKITVKPKL